MSLAALALFAAAAGPPSVSDTAERVDRYLSAIAEKVEAGDLSEADARLKVAALGKRLAATMGRAAETPAGTEAGLREAKLAEVQKTLAAAVEAGKIDAATARLKMRAVREAVEGDPGTAADDRIPVASYDEAERTLLRLVATGELEPGRAHERLRDLRSRLAMTPVPPEKAAMLKKIKRAVADGVLTEGEAKAKAKALLGK